MLQLISYFSLPWNKIYISMPNPLESSIFKIVTEKQIKIKICSCTEGWLTRENTILFLKRPFEDTLL